MEVGAVDSLLCVCVCVVFALLCETGVTFLKMEGFLAVPTHSLPNMGFYAKFCNRPLGAGDTSLVGFYRSLVLTLH